MSTLSWDDFHEPTEPSLVWLDEMNGHRKEKNFFETRCNGALAV